MSRSSEGWEQNRQKQMTAGSSSSASSYGGPCYTTVVGGGAPGMYMLPPPPMGMVMGMPPPSMGMPMPMGMMMMPMHPMGALSVPAPIPLGDGDDDDDPLNPHPDEKPNMVPMHGSKENFNMNTLLHSTVTESEYFRALYQLRTYPEVLDEIYRSVSHVEAWQAGTSRMPSTCFCLLLKCMLMKLTFKQMKQMLDTDDCPYVRAMGFLYLRYTCPPKDLWKWYEPYLEDDEEIRPSTDTTISMTIGAYCIKLLTEMQYFGTTLPRIPVPIERKIKVMLLLLDEKKKRRKNNQRGKDLGAFQAGVKVRAIYSDEENEPAWYEAVIDSVSEDLENKYWVTFPEYGNTECVDLGDMELLDKSGLGDQDGKADHRGGRGLGSDGGGYSRDSRDRLDGRGVDNRRGGASRGSRSRSRDRRDGDNGGGLGGSSSSGSSSTTNLLEKVMQSQRDQSSTGGN